MLSSQSFNLLGESVMTFTLSEFFSMFCLANNRLELFVSGDWVRVSLNRFMTFNNVQFVMYGREWTVRNGMVTQIKGS